jgi:hypothetical protein
MVRLNLRLPATLLFWSAALLACDCSISTLCSDLGAARAVFVGRVLEPVSAQEGNPGSGSQPATVTVQVIERFLGVAPSVERIRLHTYAFTSCSVALDPGIDYILFARSLPDGSLYIGRCNLPIVASSSAGLLEILRKVRDDPSVGILDGSASIIVPEQPGNPETTPSSIDQMRLVFEGPITTIVPISTSRRFNASAIPVGEYRFRMEDPAFRVHALFPLNADTATIPTGPFACSSLQLQIQPR